MRLDYLLQRALPLFLPAMARYASLSTLNGLLPHRSNATSEETSVSFFLGL